MMDPLALRPEWIKPENLRWAFWGWEPLAARRRLGGHHPVFLGDSEWASRWHDRLFAEKTIRQMKGLGINLAVTHFFKGFGLKAEQKEMEIIRDFAARCHEHGVRVLGYTQFRSIYYETFLAEEPRAAGWIQRRRDGTLNDWGGAYYRWSPCVNSKEFIDYLKKVVRHGAEWAGLDGFHFDNAYANPCYCDRCKELFRGFLRREVRDERRMGFVDFSHVELPPQNRDDVCISDPLYQEWIRFRVESLTNAWKELYLFIKSINPDLCMLTNPAYPRALGWANNLSVHAASCGRYTDLMFAENGNFPSFDGDKLITQISGFKQAENCGYHVVPTTWKRGRKDELRCPGRPEEVALSLAEAAAFGGIAGTNWAMRTTRGDQLVIDDSKLARPLREHNDFMKNHRELYEGAVTEARAALLHSFESFAYRSQETSMHATGMEQILTRANIPYDIVFAEHLERAGNYRLLILAGQGCLPDVVVRRVIKHVENGGALLLTGESGVFNEHGLEREFNAFQKILSHPRVIHWPDSPEKVDLDEAKSWIYTIAVSLPKAHAGVERGVKKLLGPENLPFEIAAPQGVIANWRRLPGGRHALHLINYRNEQKMKGGVTVRFSAAAAGNRRYALYSPERGRERSGAFGRQGGTLKIGPMETYKVVLVEE